MKTTISMKHETYMVTIKEVIDAIESATNCKVISISYDDDKLHFTVESIEPVSDDTEKYQTDNPSQEFWDEYQQEKDNEGFD